MLSFMVQLLSDSIEIFNNATEYYCPQTTVLSLCPTRLFNATTQESAFHFRKVLSTHKRFTFRQAKGRKKKPSIKSSFS